MRKVQNIPWSRNLRQKHNSFSCMPCFLLISDKLGPFCTAGHSETFKHCLSSCKNKSPTWTSAGRKINVLNLRENWDHIGGKKIVNSTSYGEERKRIWPRGGWGVVKAQTKWLATTRKTPYRYALFLD